MSWCHVGCPDIAEQCHCEQPCNCSPKVSLEKILGNVQLLHIITGFRTKPGTLNHISSFILTVQTLTAGKAVPNILIAAWAGGRDISVEILLVPQRGPGLVGEGVVVSFHHPVRGGVGCLELRYETQTEPRGCSMHPCV